MVKKCIHCGGENLRPNSETCSPRCYQAHRRQTLPKACAICGVTFRGRGQTCSPPHAQELRKRTNLEKFGTEWAIQSGEAKAKRVQTNLEKYGVEHPLQGEASLEKLRETNRERYGVAYAPQAPQVQEKFRETNLARYGAKNPWGSEKVKNKLKETNLLRRGVPYVSQDPEVKERIKDTLRAHYGVTNPSQSELIKEERKRRSQEKWGVDHPFQAQEVKKKIGLTKLKLYGVGASVGAPLPELSAFRKELFERFGPLSPNFTVTLNPEPSPRNFHFQEALKARAQDRHLLQFYPWDTAILFKLLGGKLTRGFRHFSAHCLTLSKLELSQASVFLQRYHPQGGLPGRAHFYGLSQGEELLAVASFGESRYRRTVAWEWLRYGVKEGVIIHGGHQRLFKAFQGEFHPKSVISYVDFNHTTRATTFLNSCGFRELSPTGPSLVWSKATKKINQNTLTRIGAPKLLGVTSNGLSNRDLMLQEGWHRVYIAGNRVYLWNS